jgi:hypothetical protein
LTQVHADVLGQVVGPGEALFAQQALIWFAAVLRAPMTSEFVAAAETPRAVWPRASANISKLKIGHHF